MSGGLSDMMMPGLPNSEDELPPKHLFFCKEKPLKKTKKKKGKKGKRGRREKKSQRGYGVL